MISFTVITPSLNQLDYLKRCVASVRDQIAGGEPSIRVHHHIQDGGSTDGTIDWLRQYEEDVRGQRSDDGERGMQGSLYSFSFSAEQDDGMYDALNRGIDFSMKKSVVSCQTSVDRRNNSIVAWLNCDEQYLPGTLSAVSHLLSEDSSADVFCGDVLLVDEQGALLSYRKGYALRRMYIEASHLYTLSCATFYRQHVFERVGLFDTSFRAAADEEFFLQVLRAGMRAKHVRQYFSTFTFLPQNLGGSRLADREHLEMKSRAAGMTRFLKPGINLVRLIEKWMSGAYHQKLPFKYAIFTDHLDERSVFAVDSATWKWPQSSAQEP